MKTRSYVRQLFLLAVILVSSALQSSQAMAQATSPQGQWVWIGGNQQDLQFGSFGTLGVPSTTNLPGAISNASVWKDSQGRMWYFGGAGYIYEGTYSASQDMWLFDPSAGSHGEWTWMSPPTGSAAQGDWGAEGVFSAQNAPPTRLGAMNWMDHKGRLWIFGGWFDPSGPAYMNDLWAFDPSLGTTGEWAWMGGNARHNAPGDYGTLGQPAESNIPGARAWGATFVDADGNFWLYGGLGFDANGDEGPLNDLWVFRPAQGESGEWTWMGGSSTVSWAGQSVESAQGQFAPGNTPGGRYGAAQWIDNQGHLWLFGGEVEDAQGNYGSVSDMWQFDPSRGQYGEWAWMGGSSAVSANPSSVTGTPGIPAPGNLPAPRKWTQYWTDQSGNFWLYGGDDSLPNLVYDAWSDLWVYSPTLEEWAQVNAGTNVPDYGTEYVAAASNYPGWRDAGASFAEDSGNVLIFGGRLQGMFEENDLWQFTAPPTVTSPVFSVPAGFYNNPQRVMIADTTSSATIYYTTDGSVPSAGSNIYTAPVIVTPPETLNAVAVLDGYLYSPMGTAVYTDLPPAAAPTFSPAPGTYTSTQTVTISDTTPGATIYYSTLGTAPTVGSTAYSGAITVSSTQTIHAIAIASGSSQSPVATAAYAITPPAAAPPTFSETGIYSVAPTVSISDTTPGATIYYTTDGSIPTAASTQYTAPIEVTPPEIIQAIAVAAGLAESQSAADIISPPADFMFASNTNFLTINSGSQGNLTLTVTPQNGFNSAVTFACSGLPTGATCSFNPSSVTPSGGSAVTTTLTIAASASAAATRPGRNPFLPAAGLALAGCLLAFTRRRALRLWLLPLAAFAVLGALSACGGGGTGGGSSGGGSTTSTVTVTATSGSLQQSTTITLTVN